MTIKYRYKIADLSEVQSPDGHVRATWNGAGNSRVVTLVPRRIVPIPRTASNFQVYTTTRPMRLGDLSREIYGDESMWSLLAEWNGLEAPWAWWLIKALPEGQVILYMTFERYHEIVRGDRVPSFVGSGDLFEPPEAP